MYKALYIFTFAGFFVVSPLILSIRFAKPEEVPWWLVLLIIAIGSWLLVNTTVYFYYEHLGVLIQSQVNPPQELVDRWAADGAKRVFALFFGWLYGFIYSVPYFLVYLMAYFIRRKRQGVTSVA
jgi:hypothetical protein